MSTDVFCPACQGKGSFWVGQGHRQHRVPCGQCEGKGRADSDESAAKVSGEASVSAIGSGTLAATVEKAIGLLRKSERTGWMIYASDAKKLLEEALSEATSPNVGDERQPGGAA